jgi:nucleoside-diphosphate-sugar epimerase
VQDLDSLKSGAAQADAVIHTAFIHDFSKFKESCEIDRLAVTAMGEALKGSAKPLIVTSGTGLLPSGRKVTEDDTPLPTHPRVASEQAAEAMRAAGVNVSVMRLPPSVHGDGDHGFVPLLIGMAREKGVSAMIGEGKNVWAAVHRLDAARLYRLAVEKGQGPARYHATAEEGVPFKEIAGVIGKRLGLPVVSKAPEEAAQHFTWFAHFAAMDALASSAKTRATTGWQPTGPALIADIDRDAYFK